MQKLNVEFKTRLPELSAIRERLKTLNPRLVGTDRQRDTYFEVPEGRLKLREGNIENALIFYRRSNDAAVRESLVELVPVREPLELQRLLRAALPQIGIVEKDREIYFVGETKIHLDTVRNHGCFLEVEAPNPKDAAFFLEFFGLKTSDLEGRSYIDLVS